MMDNDPALRQKAEILSREGYKVLQARSAQEALRIARNVTVVHLFITDFSMRQVDGLNLSHRFRSIHPQTPVLLISGSLPLLRHGTPDLAHAVLLAKPFVLDQLRDTVRMLLGADFFIRVQKPWAHD